MFNGNYKVGVFFYLVQIQMVQITNFGIRKSPNIRILE